MSKDAPLKRTKKTKLLSTQNAQDDNEMSSSTSASSEEEKSKEIEIDLNQPAPLSRKASRKKRKLDTTDSADADANEESPTKKLHSEGADPTLAKGKFGIWIGNLSFSTTEGSLRNFFESNEVGSIVRVNMPKGKKEGEHNKGFAYTDFTNPTSVEKAIELSESSLDGRNLLIKNAQDYSGRPESASPITNLHGQSLSKTARKIANNQKNPPGPTLFIGNLSFEANEEVIGYLFTSNQLAAQAWLPKKPVEILNVEGDAVETATEEPFLTVGPGIRKIRLGTFEDTGKCKGWAFIDFHSIPQASAALLNPRNHRLQGRSLVVEYAGADAIRRGGNRVPVNASTPNKDIRKPSRDVRNPRNRPPPLQDASEQVPQAPKQDVSQSEQPDVPKPQRGERQPGKGTRGGPSSNKKMKSGEALAKAPRAKVNIIPSEGKKIKFD